MPDRIIIHVHVSEDDVSNTGLFDEISAVACGDQPYVDLGGIDRTSGADVTVRIVPAEEN